MQLIDNTLRESLQVPGIGFSSEFALSLLGRLVEAGLRFFDVGIAGSDQDWQRLGQYPRKFPQARCAISIRALSSDLEAAASAGFLNAFVMLPCSELHVEQKFNTTVPDILANLKEVAKQAHKLNLNLYWVAEDSSRGSETLVADFVQTAASTGAAGIMMCDTLGIMTPDKVPQWIKTAKEAAAGTPLGIHCHNDYGLALANTLQALPYVKWASGTMLGLGERAGNLDILQLVAVYEDLYQKTTPFSVQKLAELSREIENETQVPIAAQRPLVGWTAFRHESGIHVNGLLKSTRLYEPAEPERYAQQREFLLGGTSGRSLIEHILTSHQRRADPTTVEHLFQRLRQYCETKNEKPKASFVDSYYKHLRSLSISDETLLAWQQEYTDTYGEPATSKGVL